MKIIWLVLRHNLQESIAPPFNRGEGASGNKGQQGKGDAQSVRDALKQTVSSSSANMPSFADFRFAFCSHHNALLPLIAPCPSDSNIP